MKLLVLEASTSSLKAMVYDSAAGADAQAAVPIRNRKSAEALLQELSTLARQLAQGLAIEAIALVGIWHSLVLIEPDGTAASRLYTWEDAAFGAPAAAMLSEQERDYLYQETGCMPHGMYPLAMLKRLGIEGCLRGKRVCSAGGYVFFMLTGRWEESLSMASGSGLVSLRQGEYCPAALEWAGLKQENLPALGSWRRPGRLGKAFANLLGLREGIPVLPAYPDGAMNHFALEDVRDMTLSVGTSAAVRMLADGEGKAAGIWRYLSADDEILAGAATSGACNCLDWARDSFFGREIAYETLSQYPVERAGLPYFLPYLFGERCPGWDDSRRGGFCGLERTHGLIEMYHSVMEGILFGVRQCYDAVTAYCGAPRRILVSGGILKDMTWLAMLAGILGRDISIDCWEQASLMGGAALGLRCLGEDIRPTREEERIYPREEDVALYHGRYIRFLEYYHGSR